MNSSELNQYAEMHSSAEPAILQKIRRETHLRTVYPQMLSGPLQGRFLAMISKMIHPGKVLEIGTFTGYSALCFCEGLDKDGQLHTIESNPEMSDMAQGYFEEAGESRIVLHRGDALEVIDSLEGMFDLVFIDAAKEEYLHYYEKVVMKVRPGGIILVDNVLWGGKVLDSDGSHDRETAGIVSFNEHVLNDARVELVMLPIRDGVSVIRVNGE